ncbi:MAG: hypothetical protein ACO4AI_07430, partial [Prochlorothrix sp.]
MTDDRLPPPPPDPAPDSPSSAPAPNPAAVPLDPDWDSWVDGEMTGTMAEEMTGTGSGNLNP